MRKVKKRKINNTLYLGSDYGNQIIENLLKNQSKLFLCNHSKLKITNTYQVI